MRNFAYLLLALSVACQPSKNPGAGDGGGIGPDAAQCGTCFGLVYTPCTADDLPGDSVTCDEACADNTGCVACIPGGHVCVGNDIETCGPDGNPDGTPTDSCDGAAGEACSHGQCVDACQAAAERPSNLGCEFWAVDLDQQDGLNDPASEPWGVVLSNGGESDAQVTIELNSAAVGATPTPQIVYQGVVAAGTLSQQVLPTRELDCGVAPNQYSSPGTCLSSRAYRIKSNRPIVVYQFNTFTNAYSNDASLLLPTNALGTQYRVIGWPAGHPVMIPGFNILDRSYVTIVGVKANTTVHVRPSWRIKGNPPIAATAAGGDITVTLGAFDVLNLETDDGTFQDDPKTMADLTATLVETSGPVAVFSGVETTSAPGGVVTVPTPPGWMDGDTCCLDHLEDQMFPIDAVGKHYVITRSPIRSTGGFAEPDVLRFVGVAEPSTVTTSLPAPFDSFTILPGEVKTTWTQDDVVVTATAPVMVGQILISNEYVDGPYIGDPSLTVFPPVEQYRNDYQFLTPTSWTQNYVVIAAPVGAAVLLDGAPTSGCVGASAGMVEGVTYESRRCPVADGVHRLTGDMPFGIIAYGYGTAGSYALAGGADVKHVYNVPPIP